ncbi:hypothetical protein TRVL_04489 [Trypanosoma vivax]|nr:hypothetical protein TRVL_04489 [Trypanosoma vivax]
MAAALCEYTTAGRIRQHHLDPSTGSNIDANLYARLAEGLNSVHEAAAAIEPLTPKASSIVCREVDNFMSATTPEHRVRCVSHVTGALREPPFFQRRCAVECALFLKTLATSFVFPLLLHSSVRYLHRALATLIRTVYVVDEELEGEFEAAFFKTHLCCWPRNEDGRRTLTGGNVTDRHLLKDTVMCWVNCIDSTMCVAAPLFPSVFTRTFLDVVPLLGDCLEWMVDNACMRCTKGKSGEMSCGMLLGEDLSYVRYGIRVVTTYVHKFLHLLTNVLEMETEVEVEAVQRDIVGLLSPALSMLSSDVFPKDVLNGAGLLVSSMLTIRTCNSSLLLDICRYCHSTGANAETVSSTSSSEKRWIEKHVKELVLLVCARDVSQKAREHPSYVESLREIFCCLTDNGRFALMKGLLAHLSTPLHADVGTLGVLMKPAAPLSGSSMPSTCMPFNMLVALYDVIMPAAVAFCSTLHAPDTRFMAVQTIDSVVRHLVAVFTCVADLLEISAGVNQEGTTRVTRRGVRRVGGIERLSEAEQSELAVFLCSDATGLTRSLNQATEVIINLWDDSTQQVAGPLYGTYGEILAVHTALERCLALMPQNLRGKEPVTNAFYITESLQRALLIPNERRGKYHALLALIGVIDVPRLLTELGGHYLGRCDDGCSESVKSVSATGIEALCCFIKMLLSGVGNPKVGSAAGEVFAKTSFRVRQFASKDADTDVLFVRGIIEPLVKALLVPGYCSELHLQDSVRISNIVTHMVTPCLKADETYLPMLMSSLSLISDDEENHSRVSQSVVEIVCRARAVGRDISPYIQPTSPSFRAVLASLQAQSSEIRYAALGLCVLSTRRAEPVEHWQCQLMEWYLTTNMLVGGDSAAMRNLLETYKKWMRRLADSFANQTSKQRRKAEGHEKSNEYKELVCKHCTQTVSCIAPHIGETVEWCHNLSLERRVTAMLLYSLLLKGVSEFLPDTQFQALSAQLFPHTLVGGLLESLSSGWVKARNCARIILELYCQYAPETVFSSQYLGHPAAASDAKKGLKQARTFSKAEGKVLRYMLVTYHTRVARNAAASEPEKECRRRLSCIELELSELNAKLSELQALGVQETFSFVKLNPLHGTMSLCASMLSDAWGVKQDINEIYEVSNALLLCCCKALRVCSLLVGNQSSNSTVDEDANVDCRGHAFDKNGSCNEAAMRTVVNNTWLTIRTSATAVERVVSLVNVGQLSLDVIRSTGYVLLDTLLRTKHNGVMRVVRQALRTVSATLLRSRDAVYHSLPAEMLEFLLGPNGVTSISVARMLRRSQGLPHAVLAVLEGEDPGVPAVLFPRAMKVLLQVAAGDRGEVVEERAPVVTVDVQHAQRSNALNVLKFIFENKAFASRSVSFLEAAFWIAATGFNDSTWCIRNSSLMLFSAVLPRFVGEHPSTGGVGVNTSLHDIATRVPQALTFTYEELAKSCVSPIPQLSVFPLLQMLSMLAPDPPHLATNTTVSIAVKEKDVMALDTSRIVSAVLRCGSSSNLMVRAASSVALTSLIPPTRLKDFLLDLGCVLINSEVSANALHGALLHLQQFHALYVGTLRRQLRARVMCSGATASTGGLVSRIIVDALSNPTASSNLKRMCLRCPTVAASFFGLVSDALFYYTSDKSNPHSPALAIAHFGLSVLHPIMCSPTSFYGLSRGYHVAVLEDGALFALLSVRCFSQVGEEQGHRVWCVLREIFSSASGEALQTFVMDHLSHHTFKQRWTSVAAEEMMQQFALFLECDLVLAALHMLRRDLASVSYTSDHSCMDLLRMSTLLEFLVTFCNRDTMSSQKYSHLIESVENTLLGRMDPLSEQPLGNADVQCWAIRFLARCRAHRQTSRGAFIHIISHHSLPWCNVQCRAAVVDALRDALFTASIRPSTDENCAVDHCKLLLILLKLLFDDVHDVRMLSCQVASSISSSGCTVFDHTTCVIALVSQLREHCESGVLHPETVKQYLLRNGHEILHCSDTIAPANMCEPLDKMGQKDKRLNAVLDCEDSDSDSDSDDDNSDDKDEGEVLFQKEADNVFAEGAMLTYLFSYITGLMDPDVPRFTVLDELLHAAKQRGSVSLLYAALL